MPHHAAEQWRALTAEQQHARIERAVAGRAAATARARVDAWLAAGHLTERARVELAERLLTGIERRP